MEGPLTIPGPWSSSTGGERIDDFEFAKVMVYIATACGKSLSADAQEVYYDLLADLPLSALRAGVKAVLVEHVYPTFPTVGQLRQAAMRVIGGSDASLLAIEAWAMVTALARDYDFDDPQAGDAVTKLPPKVREVAKAIGWSSIYNSRQSETLRAQFCKAFDTIQERDRKQAALPAPVKDEIERQDLARLTGGIGRRVLPG